MGSLRVAVDIGGTFTDICIIDEDGSALRVAKVPTTADPIEGVIEGVRQAEVDLREVSLFSHGTTVATNALITRGLPPAAMVTTKGFRDVIEIRRGNREDLWDAYADVAEPYIRRRDRLEVTERIDFSGEVVTELDEDEAERVAEILRKREVATVAICLINAHANPAHEQRLLEILEARLPGVMISTSSDVLPELFEHERFSTTVSNAVLSPLVSNYISRLDAGLRDGGYDGDLVLLHSGGGMMNAKTAERYAARLAASGLAAGAIASRHIATMCGFENAIGLDMGGTSTDISLVYEGEARVTKEWFVEFGYPILFPSIEVLTIGAGGGSLAWLDETGALHSGPKSAGASPGPAAYGRGGTEPTTTDANLVLGRLGTGLIGGEMSLDRELAADAVRAGVAEPLELEVEDAAAAVIRVANANMADALRLISIRRGYDPREFCLVVFGGAGPLHGVELARELSIPTVLVPLDPGITSAFGCLLVDVRHDLTRMYLADTDAADPKEIEAAFAELEAEGRELLDTEGVPADQQEFSRTIDMRYRGQWRSLAVTVGSPIDSLDEAIATFHDEHERAYNIRREGTPVEIYRIGLRATGVTPKPQLPRHQKSDAGVEPIGRRMVRFDGYEDAQEAAVYARDQLGAGARVDGPAIIEQLDTTTVVPPDVTAEVDEWLNLRISVG